MQAYAIWNNKGRTGKSTVTFHVASRFAEMHGERKVLVIDMCPQANASMLFLGGGLEGENKLLRICSQFNARSVVGYISDSILTRKVPQLDSYYVHVNELNEKMPSNLYVMSGDGNLELMAPPINEKSDAPHFQV